MSAHTPAPWVIEADAGMSASYHMRRAVITSAEHEANARLIAAAPELLAALQRAEFCIRGYTQSSQRECRLDDIRAAIAKAGGAA